MGIVALLYHAFSGRQPLDADEAPVKSILPQRLGSNAPLTLILWISNASLASF